MDENRLMYCAERLDAVTNRLNPLLRSLENRPPEEPALSADLLGVLRAMQDLVEAVTGLRDSEASG